MRSDPVGTTRSGAASDRAVLRDQAELFGPVAPSPRRPSPGECWMGSMPPALARVCCPSMTVADLTRATDGHPAAIVIELLQDHASRSHARHDSGLDRIHLPRRRFPRRAMGRGEGQAIGSGSAARAACEACSDKSIRSANSVVIRRASTVVPIEAAMTSEHSMTSRTAQPLN